MNKEIEQKLKKNIPDMPERFYTEIIQKIMKVKP
jgi:hypothetical protein